MLVNSSSLGIPFQLHIFFEKRVKVSFRLFKTLLNEVQSRLPVDAFDICIKV